MSELADSPIRLRIASAAAHLPVVRAALERFCQLLGLDADMGAEIVLAVDEALTNIIRHAYHGAADKPIEISFACVGAAGGGQALRIELRDWGESVDPSRIKSRDLDDIRPGGLGVHLMQNCMDTVEYAPGPEGGTRLTMTRALRPRSKE